MGRVRLGRNTFNSGELDPLLAARYDTRAHAQGAGTLKNVVCLPQGGVRRRGGLEFLDTISEGDARLIPFSFNTEQNYVLVFVATKMYVYKDGVLVTNINASGNDYLTVPWSLAEIQAAGWTQSADTLIVCHEDYVPRKIYRGGSDSTWSIDTASFKFEPVEDFNNDYDAATFTLGATTGNSVSLTCSASVFTAEHVGGRFEGKGGIADIVGYTSGTSITVDILDDFSTTSVPGNRAFLAEPSWSAEHGYPSCVTFHEGRLWMAGSTAQPQTLWGSVTNDFFNFDYGTGLDDEGIGVTLDTEQVNAIRHLVSIRHLQILTTGGEFFVSDSPITPAKSAVKRQTRFGASTVRPAVIDGSTLFVQRTGKVVREYLFNFVEDAYTSNSASLLASHLINGPTDMSAQRGSSEQDANYVYLVNTDGTVAVYNSLREQEIAAWSKWSSDDLSFRRVTVVDDIPYFLVQLGSAYHLARIDNARYTDLHVYDAALGSETLTGLTHLNGEVVKVRADGSLLSDETVGSGQIVMDRSGTDVEAGLAFDVEIVTLPVNIDLQDGPNYVKMKRIVSVYADLYESLGVLVDNLRLSDRNFGENILNAVPEPYTDLRRVRVLGWDRLKTISVSQTDPQPLTLRSLTLEVET